MARRRRDEECDMDSVIGIFSEDELKFTFQGSAAIRLKLVQSTTPDPASKLQV